MSNEGMTFLDFIRKVHEDNKQRFIVKHYGPGRHPGTGTPQIVHGGGKVRSGRKLTRREKWHVADRRVTPLREKYEKARRAFKKADKALQGSREKRKRGEMTPAQLTELARGKVKAERAMNEAHKAWIKAHKREREKLGIS